MPQFDRTPIPNSLMHEVAQEIVDHEREQFQRKARAAGWVPLSEVLDAVWDIDAIQRWASRSVPLAASSATNRSATTSPTGSA